MKKSTKYLIGAFVSIGISLVAYILTKEDGTSFLAVALLLTMLYWGETK